jgi:hypothetical protein
MRWLLGTSGVLLALFGVFRLLTQVAAADLVVLALWLVGALVLHDAVLAPLSAALGVLTGRLPARLRRYVQLGLTISALVTVIAAPLIYRAGTQPPEKALLRQDYAANLGLLVGVIAAAVAALYAVRVLRDARAAKVRPPEDHTSSTA